MTKRYDRLLDKYIAALLKELPAIAVDGLKAVGKTETTSRLASTIFRLDVNQDRLLLANDAHILETFPNPCLIDEWQKQPEIWDYVKRSVDGNFSPGRFILTGSVSAKNIDVHSGAGRIVRVHMYPLSIEERGIETPTYCLHETFEKGSFSNEVFGETSFSLGNYVNEIYLSGLPALRTLTDRGRMIAVDSFIDNLLSHDFEQEGVTLRQSTQLRRWLKAYAAAISSTANYTEILDASTPGVSEKPAAKTTIAYREVLERIKIIDELPAWEDGQDYYSRLKKSPKHYLADPAFATFLLGIDKEALLCTNGMRAEPTMFDKDYGDIIGRLFEALVFQSLRTYAEVNDAKLSYFHTRNGQREIDFILSRGGKVIAIEVKLSKTITDKDVRHLNWLKKVMGDRLADAIVINTGNHAYRRKADGIAVVPFALLGA